MKERHPFGNFVPKNTQYLFLGSFTGKLTDKSYDWFFGSKRSQFWPILEQVYNLELKTKEQKQKLFRSLGLAITDIILECERKLDSNLDNNLINMVFNTTAITKIIRENKIRCIYFSSRFAEKLFRKNLKKIILEKPGVELITLPSPSPRYAAMSKQKKIEKYKELLPKMEEPALRKM